MQDDCLLMPDWLMTAARWPLGFILSLLLGGVITPRIVAWLRTKYEGYSPPVYAVLPSECVGFTEAFFFTIAVGFKLQAVVPAMVAWIGIKMLAHWNSNPVPQGEDLKGSPLFANRFTALIGSLISLLHALIGGLICSGEIPFYGGLVILGLFTVAASVIYVVSPWPPVTTNTPPDSDRLADRSCDPGCY